MYKLFALMTVIILAACGIDAEESYPWQADSETGKAEARSVELAGLCQELRLDDTYEQVAKRQTQDYFEDGQFPTAFRRQKPAEEILWGDDHQWLDYQLKLEGVPSDLVPPEDYDSLMLLFNEFSDKEVRSSRRSLTVILPSNSYLNGGKGQTKAWFEFDHPTSERRKISLVYAIVGYHNDWDSPDDIPETENCQEVSTLEEFLEALEKEQGCVWLNGHAFDYAPTCAQGCEQPKRWLEPEGLPPLPVCW